MPVVRLFVALFFFFFFFVVLPLSAGRKGVVVGSADRGRRLRAGWVRPWPWRVDWKTIAGLTSRQRGPSRPPAERPFHCSQRIGNMVWLVFFFSLSRPGMGGVATSPVAPVVILTAHGLAFYWCRQQVAMSPPPPPLHTCPRVARSTPSCLPPTPGVQAAAARHRPWGTSAGRHAPPAPPRAAMVHGGGVLPVLPCVDQSWLSCFGASVVDDRRCCPRDPLVRRFFESDSDWNCVRVDGDARVGRIGCGRARMAVHPTVASTPCRWVRSRLQVPPPPPSRPTSVRGHCPRVPHFFSARLPPLLPPHCVLHTLVSFH